MQKVRDGDLAKMAVLFERHHRPLFRYFLRLTGNREFSEDLAQDVFFRMLKYRHSYQDGSPFTPWMYQVARNAHMDGVQKRKGEARLHDERDEPRPELGWVEHLLDRYMLSREHRGDGIYAVGRKVGPAKDRYPTWLYS